MNLIEKKTVDMESFRPGRDDEDEHVIIHHFKRDKYYLFGIILIWKRDHSFVKRSFNSWLRDHIL